MDGSSIFHVGVGTYPLLLVQRKHQDCLKNEFFYFIYEACISNELKNKGYFLFKKKKKKRRNVKVIVCHIVCYFGLEMAKNNTLLGFLKKL